MAEGPCKSVKDVLELQRQNLIAAINDSFQTESKRVERLGCVKSSKDRKFLKRRYEIERQADMNKIERLKSDYDALAKKIEGGEFEMRDESVYSAAKSSAPQLLSVQSRFHGLDTAEEIRFFRGMWGAIDKRDSLIQARYARQEAIRQQQAQAQNRAEQDKLRLLHERRDVLTQLIDIQRQAAQERATRSASSSSFPTSRTSSRGYERPGTSCSVASSASFTVANLNLHNKLMAKPSNVPSLDFSRLN